ncbi:hypothetical protein AB0M43_10610 [Longispora sp. NPDC051575]|uniref:hypothetical protein n=1 Tax=Longispora sp. NPDC051575 TaxID=3154943 RepID=UPI0034449D71
MVFPYRDRPLQLVKDPDGNNWTVAVVRGNQWRCWPWIHAAYRDPADSAVGELGCLFMPLALLGVFPMWGRWLWYHLTFRTHRLVTVRPGIRGRTAAREGAVFADVYPTRDLANRRADALSADIEAGNLPGWWPAR